MTIMSSPLSRRQRTKSRVSTKIPTPMTGVRPLKSPATRQDHHLVRCHEGKRADAAVKEGCVIHVLSVCFQYAFSVSIA
jgi:hypothetical protein